jgi:hypothetical protein
MKEVEVLYVVLAKEELVLSGKSVGCAARNTN